MSPLRLLFAVAALTLSAAAAHAQAFADALTKLPTPLTPDQSSRIAAVQSEAAQKRVRLAADPKLVGSAKAVARRTLDTAEREGVLAVLTREQRKQLAAIRAAAALDKEKVRKHLVGSLTDEQKAQLRTLLAGAGKKPAAFDAVLTPEQSKEFKALGSNPKVLGKL